MTEFTSTHEVGLDTLDPGTVMAGVACLCLGERQVSECPDVEDEREKTVGQNIKRLKKRFGESFVKGGRTESGGYAGDGARELLSSFLEIPGFADKLMRLIPNRHLALPTLQNNQDFIIACLQKEFQDEGGARA